jgi:hypothetical protein
VWERPKLSPVGMAEHLAQGRVLIGQLEATIVLGIEPRAQHPSTKIAQGARPDRPVSRRALPSSPRPGGRRPARSPNTASRSRGEVSLWRSPRKRCGMSSRERGSRAIAALSSWPSFNCRAMTVRVAARITILMTAHRVPRRQQAGISVAPYGLPRLGAFPARIGRK